MDASIKRPKIVIEAIVSRANGTVEELGVISEGEDAKVKENFEEVVDNG